MARMITCTDIAPHGDAIFLTQGRQYAVLGEEAGRFLVSNDVDNHVWYTRNRFGDALTPRKHAELIHAWADGAAIQARNNNTRNHRWFDCNNPVWSTLNFMEYRIKPAIDQQAVNATESKIGNAHIAINTVKALLHELELHLNKLKSGD